MQPFIIPHISHGSVHLHPMWVYTMEWSILIHLRVKLILPADQRFIHVRHSQNTLVSITSSRTLTLNGMIFNSNASYSTYNTPLISVNAGELTMNGNNTFDSIKRESGNGGVFELSSMSSAQSISGATFTSCSLKNGGVISITLSSSSYTLTLSSLTFTSCSASNYGGGVYIDGGSYISTNTLSFSSLSFTSCSTMKGVNGMYISGSSLSSFIGYDSWNTLVPSS